MLTQILEHEGGRPEGEGIRGGAGRAGAWPGEQGRGRERPAHQARA